MDVSVLTMLIPIFGIVFGNAFAFGVVFIFIRSRYKERMALIERGATAAEVYGARKVSHELALKNGLFLIGFALGLFIAAVINEITSINAVAAYFACPLFFGGLGLVAYYIIHKRNERSQLG